MAADFSGSGILPPPHLNAERSHSDAEIAAAIAEMQAGTVEMVETGHRKTYIIGTAHLSNESTEDARWLQREGRCWRRWLQRQDGSQREVLRAKAQALELPPLIA